MLSLQLFKSESLLKAHQDKNHGLRISKNKVMGLFSLGFCPRSLYLNINGLFQVKGDEYMIVNHEENDAVSYLVIE